MKESKCANDIVKCANEKRRFNQSISLSDKFCVLVCVLFLPRGVLDMWLCYLFAVLFAEDGK